MADKRQGLIQQALNKVAQTAQRIFPGAQQEFAKTHWGRTLTSPAAQSFGKSLTNTVQQGVPSAYRILTPQSTQITLGKINPALSPKLKAKDQVKDAFNTVKLGATAVGLPQLGLGTALTSTALGGAFNKFGGGSFLEGAGQGLGSAGTIAGIGKLTNPLINKTASQITKGIASPMKQFAANRVATGALNIPEGMIMQGATSGIPYSLGDAAIDFGLGAAGGQTLTGQKGQIKKVGRSVVPVKDAVRQVQENLDHMVDILKRYDLQLGDMAPVRGVNKADLDLYPDAIKMWKNIYGAHIKPPRDLGQVVGELREAFNGVRTQMRMEQEGISLGLIDNNAISSDAIKTKQGKIKIQGYPTQTEIKNRAEINAGNPDLYTQRSAKLEQVYGKPEGFSPITGKYQEGLTSDEAFNQLRAQESGKLRLSTRPGQKISPSARIQATSPRLSPEGFSQSKQTARPVIDSQGQKVDTSFDGIVNSSGFDVKKKVGILDIFRTPDRVLSKMGLRKEAYDLRKAHDNYVRELPGEIDKITQWSKQVPKSSNEKIFKYLDGQGGKLDDNELRVAKEVRGYLEGWADRLGLPKEGRIASYITHIFDKEQFTKEMDPDLAKIIRERVAGSVYDPFLEKRLGALGYKQDTWAALDAYVKRATRKANLDPVLKVISQKSENFEESQFDYVKKYIAGVNMQPTKLDNMIDNTIKQLIGYKLGGRPVTAITRTMRQAGFRGALGLNVGSAVRNLTQGANTYAKLGEKHTIIGYTRLLKHLATNDFKELEETGILRNDFVQDRAINATKKFWEKTDKGLFALFELAEKINRGSAYYGAKSKALGKGMSEEQAVDYAKGIVRDTQFTFGSVDTPALLQSDIAKTFGQFQSYNMKQAEFLAEMIKNKEFAGLSRYTLSSLAVVFTLGNFIGLDPEDIIPFSGVVSGESKLGQTPAINAILKTKEALMDDKDQYGNDLTIKDRVKTATDAIIPIIPGGVQIKKTIQGLEAANQGYSESKTGRVQYAIDQSTGNKIRAGLFGKNNLPEAQEYFDSKSTVLGEKQSEFLKNSVDKIGTYKTFLENRNKEEGAKSGDSTGQASGNIFQYMKDGDIKEIDLSFQPTPPQMTGLEELDKKARSRFYGEISAKQNDIYELYEQKQISAEDAEKQLKTLDGLRSLYKSTKAKKGRKVSLKKVKMPSSKAIKLSSPKLAKIKLKTSKPKKFKIGKSTKIS